MESTQPKPYLKTSYFWVMLASIFLGPPAIFLTNSLLPSLAFLSEAQRGQILETLFNGWLVIVGITTAGNVTARGVVTILKTLLQNQLAQSTPSGDLIGIAKSASREELAGQLGLSEVQSTLHSPSFMIDDVELSDSAADIMRDGFVIDDGVMISPKGKPNEQAVLEQERAFHGNN